MRILCVCEGGNVRSVGTAFVLKQHMGHDALAASVRFNATGTLALLCGWAEKVLAMYPGAVGLLPEAAHAKLALLNVGDDVFGNAFHPQLLGFVGPRLGRWFANGCPSGFSDGKVAQL